MAWPTAHDLFNALADGQAPTDWALKVVRLIKNEHSIEACIFQDRDDISVRIAGPAPSKTNALKKEVTIRAVGNDNSGPFHTTLRVMFLNGTSAAIDEQLDQIAAESVDMISSRIRKSSSSKRQTPITAAPREPNNTPKPNLRDSASHPGKASTSRSRKDSKLKYGIFVAGPATQTLIDEIEQVAPSPYPLLILGPTGTGKERVAQGVHQASGRTGYMVSLNCAGFTDDLIGSELFGHVKGSFTGADKDREGVIQQANRGTLFLDEIGELSPRHQATLLRVLQENSVRKIGSAVEEAVDVRVIAATNRPLEEMVAHRKFREDLYYRLAGASIRTIPLSERREEILPLAEHKLLEIGARLGRPIEMTVELRELLPQLPWKGNVRELFRALEAGITRSGSGPLDPESLRISDCSARTVDPISAGSLLQFPIMFPKIVEGNRQPTPLNYADFQRQLDDLDSSLIRLFLQIGGSVDETAAWLQTTPETLRSRLEYHGIPEPIGAASTAEVA